MNDTTTLHVHRRPDERVAVVRIDVPDRPVNVLTAVLLDELESTMEMLALDDSVEGVVLSSSKEGGFLAGADVLALRKASASQLQTLSGRAQAVFSFIEGLGKPVVAAISGGCLGGGLELALACDGRVAADDLRTRLGLPEIQLGLIPGIGGTVRLPRSIGLQPALELMLSGRRISGRRARKLGLVDEVVRRSILEDVACEHVRRHAERPAEAGPRERIERRLSSTKIPRRFVLEAARRRARARTHGNYPAPELLLDVVEVGLEKGPKAGLAAESEAFGALAGGSEAQELMYLFEVRSALRAERPLDAEPRSLARMGVLGAGLMGTEIAHVTASEAHLPVRIRDKDDETIGQARSRIAELLDKGVRNEVMNAFDADRARHSITSTLAPDGLAHCDLVIEAVFEDLELKHHVLRETEESSGEHTIFASNTSAIPIDRIADASRRPQNVVGMHYFSPVVRMPLVEIVAGPRTAPEVVATCVELAKRQGKLPIVVGDGPGFYTTRILAAYLAEAYRLLAEGVRGEAIDDALVRFGFPIGPLALTDRVGLRVAAEIERFLGDELRERLEPPRIADRLLAARREGKKRGRGFYIYGRRKPEVDPEIYDILEIEPGSREVSAHEIAWRCVLPMVNEAVRCLEEGILQSKRDGDAGAVFGLGFPPFMGGPFRLVERRGPRWVLDQLERMQREYGDRFAPAASLGEHVFEVRAPAEAQTHQPPQPMPARRRAG